MIRLKILKSKKEMLFSIRIEEMFHKCNITKIFKIILFLNVQNHQLEFLEMILIKWHNQIKYLIIEEVSNE